MCEVASSAASEQSFCFKWNDYQTHLSTLAQQLLAEDCMVDVTLSVAGERIQAHRIVLCACSTLFQEILSETTEHHPTIIISDLAVQDVKSIVDFCYHGEVKIPVDNIDNLLEAAQALKIYGLMEVEGLDEYESLSCSNDDSDTLITQLHDESTPADDNPWPENDDEKFPVPENPPEPEKTVPKRSKRRSEGIKKKNYSDEMLEAAMNDLRAGQPLMDAATKNNVPRSTLYMRAKASGVRVQTARTDYPAECLKAAINAVINGSSFSQASDRYRIPKTVLWRRIQKEGHVLKSEVKKTYDNDKREAAIRALERGEKLTKVSLEFKIPKTTLFRDKIKLVDEGKLPGSFWKKRNVENGASKKLRLEEAVSACKQGKMSQAAAALAYRIPKTTIWRRLHQDSQIKSAGRSQVTKEKSEINKSVNIHADKMKCAENTTFTLCEVPSEIPITYINDSNIPEDSVIILTTEDVEALDLGESRQIMVNSVCSGL